MQVPLIRHERSEPLINVEENLVRESTGDTTFPEFTLAIEAFVGVELVRVTRQVGIVANRSRAVLFTCRPRPRNYS
jgi:hypothetical protein